MFTSLKLRCARSRPAVVSPPSVGFASSLPSGEFRWLIASGPHFDRRRGAPARFASVLLLMSLVGCGGPPALTITVPAQVSALTTAEISNYELWIFDEVGRDSTPVDCTALLDRSIGPADPNLVRLKNPISGSFGSGIVDVKDIDQGANNRVFYIDLYNNQNGLLVRIGAGCKAGVSIKGGSTVTVDIDVTAPPAVAR